MIRFLTAILATVFLSQASFANECVSEKAIRERIQSSIPNAKIISVPEDNIPIFIKAFNALPLETEATADSIILFVSPEARRAVILFFNAGCLSSRAEMPNEILSKLILIALEKEI